MGDRIEVPWRIVHVCIYVRSHFGVFTKLLCDGAVPERKEEHSSIWYMSKKHVPNYLRAIRMHNMVYGADFEDVIDFLEIALENKHAINTVGDSTLKED